MAPSQRFRRCQQLPRLVRLQVQVAHLPIHYDIHLILPLPPMRLSGKTRVQTAGQSELPKRPQPSIRHCLLQVTGHLANILARTIPLRQLLWTTSTQRWYNNDLRMPFITRLRTLTTTQPPCGMTTS